MASKACLNRLQKEYKAIMKEPVPGITAHPSPSNILEWHFILEGQPDSEYAGGVYHGKVVFPSQYPYKPPSLQMITPNGRFATNTRLCLSMTDFHPESWNPMWSVATILTGLMSFMYDPHAPHTTGAITTTKAEKEKLARESLAFNVRNSTFRKLFPEWVAKFEAEQHAAAQQQAQQAAQQQAVAADVAAGQPGAEAVAQQVGQHAAQQGQPPAGAGRAVGGDRFYGWALGAVGVAALALLLASALSTHQVLQVL